MEIRDLIDLENDTNFQQLNQQVNSFNTLKILKLENHEIRHSNILAWLLNPKENHNLSDYFLRKVMEHLLLMDENSGNIQFQKVGGILNHSLVDSHVYREVKTDKNRYIDLLIVNQQLKTVFIIENKFYSSESVNQLNDYLEFTRHTFENFTIIPIYLTLNGEEPSNSNYFILTYEKIEVILHTILMLYKDRLNNNVYQFIVDYNQILKEKFYPNQDQIVQAIDIYRNHKQTIDVLFEETVSLHKQLQFESGFYFEFMMKYKNTIQYIYKHGQNILSYSFDEFINQQFDKEVLYRSQPTSPHLLPPEWEGISHVHMKDPNYWLGKGLVVWFEQAKDSRLSIIAEIGPIEYTERRSLLEKIEQFGIPIKESSKLEKARYTRFFTKKIDINKWDDMAELTQGMLDLYNSSEFKQVRNQVATILNNDEVEVVEPKTSVEKQTAQDIKVKVQRAFRKWMVLMNIPETDYRASTKYLSFIIPLFDSFKERLGETREKWWWYNGPFLFWFNISEDSLYFTLEVGPIEANQRVVLMEQMKEQGIVFSKKGLSPEAKFNRIFSQSVAIKGLGESELLQVFQTLYNHHELQETLNKIQHIYNEFYSNFE